MASTTEADLTESVIARLARCEDLRFKTVMESLIRHLHAFVRDVQLTEAEWFEGIGFLTETGQKCDERRQEYILLSDVLGVSMLVDAINHPGAPGATESTVFGPFYREGAPELPMGANVAQDTPGEPTFVSGCITDPAGHPVAGAVVDVWAVDGEGFYDSQRDDLPGMRARGRFRTGADGRYSFRTVKPVEYSVPTDGPVGRVLDGMRRHAMRPAHLHFMIQAPGYVPLITHIFVKGDRYLDSDAVFGVKPSLITEFERHPPGTAPDDSRIDSPWYTACYDFGLTPSRAT
jgi:hydroxyquinol 1,2-dioxygenase